MFKNLQIVPIGVKTSYKSISYVNTLHGVRTRGPHPCARRRPGVSRGTSVAYTRRMPRITRISSVSWLICTGDSMPVLVRREGSRGSLRPLRGLFSILVLALLAVPVHAGVPESSLTAATAAPAVGDLAQPEAGGADWMTRVQRHLVAREYEAGTSVRGLHGWIDRHWRRQALRMGRGRGRAF